MHPLQADTAQWLLLLGTITQPEATGVKRHSPERAECCRATGLRPGSHGQDLLVALDHCPLPTRGFFSSSVTEGMTIVRCPVWVASQLDTRFLSIQCIFGKDVITASRRRLKLTMSCTGHRSQLAQHGIAVKSRPVSNTNQGCGKKCQDATCFMINGTPLRCKKVKTRTPARLNSRTCLDKSLASGDTIKGIFHMVLGGHLFFFFIRS
ncbi:hypothetical protein ElyMa_003189200 [Elysia marginata]|uniref:Uncharacterized protein n=1 Tax=Elysia marginata TaxID=1093978 RepID=A0AAV4IZF7_9GAST|nr:hypothetical protein ElyMa_003189200 [Elysia marginata]